MDVQIEGNKVTVTFELVEFDKAPRSSTGKSTILFTTRGFAPVEGQEGDFLSINYIHTGRRTGR